MLALLLACLLGAVPGDTLKEYRLDDKFKVQLPTAPEASTQKMPAGPPLKVYKANGSAGVYLVATLEIPEATNEPDDKLQTRLDAGRDQGVQNAKGKLLQETRIRLAPKYPGREILVELPATKEMLRGRLYLVEGRLYQLILVGSAEFINSPSAGKFLGSLNLSK